nr:MAG TPA: hypothetical protein [Caudoviricetes sp.]
MHRAVRPQPNNFTTIINFMNCCNTTLRNLY